VNADYISTGAVDFHALSFTNTPSKFIASGDVSFSYKSEKNRKLIKVTYKMLFSLLFSSCKLNYSSWSMERCRLGEEVTTFMNLDSAQTTTIYLHETSKSKVIFDSIPNFTLNKGEAVKISPREIKAHCSGDDCDISLWFLKYDKEGGFALADSTGAVYSLSGKLPERYISFFDFGDKARLQANNISHPRKSGVAFNFQNETGVYEEYLQTDSEFNFSSPGVLQVTRSPYNLIDVSIVTGSTKKMSSEFAQNGKIIPIIQISSDNVPVRSTDEDIYCVAATQFNALWAQWGMVALTCIVFLMSVYSTIMLLIQKIGSKRNQPVSEAEEPLVS
jgi:hypothetical protein